MVHPAQLGPEEVELGVPLHLAQVAVALLALLSVIQLFLLKFSL